MIQFLVYVLIAAALTFCARLWLSLPKWVYRKLLHFIAFSSLIVLLYSASSCTEAVFFCLGLTCLLYPLLVWLERYPWFSSLLVQKEPGEIASSLCLLFGMGAALFTFDWGYLQNQTMAAASLAMWGMGDAAAALVGIPWGFHKVHWKWADPQKSLEGTLAMILVSLLSGMAVFMTTTSFSFWLILTIVTPAAIAGAIAELISHKGNDTFTVPLVISAVLALFFYLAGLL